MIFINNDRGVSIGDSGRIYTSKLTGGQQKIWDRLAYFWKNAESIEVAEKPDGAVAELETGTLYITDTSTVGNVKVGTDGAYLYRGGRLYDLSQSVEVGE